MVVSGVVLLGATNLLTRSATVDLYFVGPPLTHAPLSESLRQSVPPQLATQSDRIEALAESQRTSDLNTLMAVSGITLGVMVAGSAILGWFVAGRVLRPVKVMTATARRISANNLDERLRLPGPRDELRDLGDTFDDLLGRLQTAFDSQRHFVANAAHELRTPLTVERTMLQVALANPRTTVADFRNVCEELVAAGREQEAMVDALLALAVSEQPIAQREPVDLGAVITNLLPTVAGEVRRKHLDVRTSVGEAWVAGDRRLLERLVSNLLENAATHNVVDGHLTIAAGSSGGVAMFSVENSGPYIPAASVPRLLEPFQRMGDSRRRHPNGQGLGLAIAKAIVDAHGGAIDVSPGPDGGLSVKVTMPGLG